MVSIGKRIVVAAVAAMTCALGASPAIAASGPELRMESVLPDPRDVESLQRGARLFVNYCLNCHSAKYMRYNRLTDIGLTEAQIGEHLIFPGRTEAQDGGALRYVPAKVGDTMQAVMPVNDAKTWFGTFPPDLSVEARIRGSRWLYNYLIGFYRDEKSTTGWNNLVFPNVAMPHVLWELSGMNRVVASEYKTHEEAQGAAIAAKGLAQIEPTRDGRYLVRTIAYDGQGEMRPVDYRLAMLDLVNFLDYIAEPSKLSRVRIGFVVLLFLGALFLFAYWLKREYWKDIH
ncbi:MAG TPA: cytochrome c1 [Casimicrobiaceae bacterium]|nr:cytochrome c1 [Casimicrobiaceae bacterium]